MLKNLLNRLFAFAPEPEAAPAPAEVPVRADNPARADVLVAEGNTLEDAGELERAEALYRQAIAAAPGHPRGHLNLGIVLAAREEAAGAIAAFERVLAIDAKHPAGNYNLARQMVLRGDTARALALVEEALRARPDFPQALELLVRVQRDEGFADEALATLRRIVEREPENWLHRSFELMMMNLVDDMPAPALFRRHVEFGTALEQAVPVRFERHAPQGDPARRLRVGYLSSDFCSHPVAFFLAPVLAAHDRTQVEVFCYSLVAKPDATTEQLRAVADHWRDVAALSDDELADAIHADAIDVLVDLMGHSSIPRLGVFCQRPAPVQVAWLGYLNTTGLTRMDFRITDLRGDPPAVSQPLHTERLVPLPASQWCYPGDPAQQMDVVPPVERNGHMTFGAFNAALKVTPAACRRWAEVLLRVPGSRLLVGDNNAARKRAAILREIVDAGVAADRVEFIPRVGADEYMALYNRVDMTFDTFPYGGGTTTLDSLWMGVPVVAATGQTPASRSAASILAALDLQDWIAPGVDGFVELAVARAADRDALRALRGALRARLQGSLLTELPRYTRDLEAAYRRMWLEKTA